MVKELKNKFIKTTMLVVTLLLVVFLTAINCINYYLTRNTNQSALNRIVNQNLMSMPGLMPENGMQPGQMPQSMQEQGQQPAPDRDDMRMLSNPDAGAQPQDDNMQPDDTAQPRDDNMQPDDAAQPQDDNMQPDDAAQPQDNRQQDSGRYFIARVTASGAVAFYDLTHDPDTDFDRMVSLIRGAHVSFAPYATGETETETGEPEPRALPSDVPDISENRPPAGPADAPGNDMDIERTADETASAPQTAQGRCEGYLYYAAGQPDGSAVYAFLDVSQGTGAMVRVALITVALGGVLWLLVLLLVFFLSGKAIVPIAESIEKQRRFITDAGHELKTPLAVIVSNVDVQELHGGKTKWLDNIRSQALRLSELTKQMLTLAKMEESGTAAFTSTTFDASRMLEDTVRIFRESASLRGIDVRMDIEPGVSLHFSMEQYQQMLELILDNALKYGKENGFLAISLRSDRKTVKLTFKNDCDALPEVDPDMLFDRFYRLDSSRSRQSGGSGIGLAVVRAIAEQGGGSAHAHFLPDQVIEFEIILQRGKI